MIYLNRICMLKFKKIIFLLKNRKIFFKILLNINAWTRMEAYVQVLKSLAFRTRFLWSQAWDLGAQAAALVPTLGSIEVGPEAMMLVPDALAPEPNSIEVGQASCGELDLAKLWQSSKLVGLGQAWSRQIWQGKACWKSCELEPCEP